jgi:TIR domain-containing protein
MPGIFISYRRADSAPITGRIHEHLAHYFGDSVVFKDVEDIPAGADFRATLEEAVNRCDVMLVIIGPTWLTMTDSQGNRRLDDPADFVRIEVESGLKRKDALVIPAGQRRQNAQQR